jgi:hypothetical protein
MVANGPVSIVSEPRSGLVRPGGLIEQDRTPVIGDRETALLRARDVLKVPAMGSDPSDAPACRSWLELVVDIDEIDDGRGTHRTVERASLRMPIRRGRGDATTNSSCSGLQANAR